MSVSELPVLRRTRAELSERPVVDLSPCPSSAGRCWSPPASCAAAGGPCNCSSCSGSCCSAAESPKKTLSSSWSGAPVSCWSSTVRGRTPPWWPGRRCGFAGATGGGSSVGGVSSCTSASSSSMETAGSARAGEPHARVQVSYRCVAVRKVKREEEVGEINSFMIFNETSRLLRVGLFSVPLLRTDTDFLLRRTH